MKNRRLFYSVFILGFALLLTGCGIFSFHPLYHESDLIEIEGLSGKWQNVDDHNENIEIKKAGNNLYYFCINSSDDTTRFEMGLLNLNGQYFIDIYPSEPCGVLQGEDCMILEMMGNNFIPVHSFMKLDYENEQLTLTGFDSERLIKLFQQNRIRLKHEIPEGEDDYVLITASTDELQKFISHYSNDEEAFEDPEKYYKL